METVRRKNRAAILKYINDHGPVSRKDLADVIGLTYVLLCIAGVSLLFK